MRAKLRHNSRVVDDPLCGAVAAGEEAAEAGCRGKVLKMDDCVGEGDAFTLETMTCSTMFPCKVSFWFLGLAWQGFADGFPGRHVWSAAGDDEEEGNHHKTATVRDSDSARRSRGTQKGGVRMAAFSLS